MVSLAAETRWRRSLRHIAAHTLRILPMPKGQKWALAGIAAELLEPGSSMEKVVRMTRGFKMLVDLGESYERRIYYSGLYGAHLTRLFKQLLEPGDTMIDGGANIGYFSLLAAKCVGEHGHVHSFEPIPRTFEDLNRNIHLNSFFNIRANNRALWRSAVELCIEIPTDTITGNAVGRLATIAPLDRGQKVTVPATTLDEYAAVTGITTVKLVKLDIEGSEVAAIAGMHQLLSEHRVSYLICELNTTLLDKLGIPHSAMRVALQNYGYSCYYINCYKGFARTEHLALVDTSLGETPDLYGDYLFVAPGMPVKNRLSSILRD